jgi:hypothetical protein
MADKLLLTYSLLGYLKETSKNPTGSIIELFLPIVKKALSNYSKEQGLTEIKGKSFVEIKDKIQEIFELEIPIPILQVILKSIEKEISNEQIFKLYTRDTSFIIKSYVFNDIEDQIIRESENIKLLEKDYKMFCTQTNTSFNFSDLKDFILAQKIDLFSDKKSSYLDLNFSIPKYIQQKFENDEIFNIITNIYLGGIISSYLTLKITKKVTETELLIDTNFFISLIDLNTEESYHTCKQLYDLCKDMGFRFSILNTTVEQIKVLLNNRITDFASREFIGSVRTADIFNACCRKGIDKTQLERIRDNVPAKIQELGIIVIQDAQIKEIREKAEKSKTYKDLLAKRDYAADSALNDAIADLYVKNKRGTNTQEFADVKCWFLHNSFNSHYFAQKKQVYERYALGANELLVLLWLSNPSQTAQIQDKVIAQGTLSSYVTKYRRNKMPSKELLKVIKNRADKALEQGQITEKDVFNTCLRMTEGEITNDDFKDIETLQDDEFAAKFKEFSKSENEQIKNLEYQNKEKDNTINEQKKEIEDLKNDVSKQQQKIDTLGDDLLIIKLEQYEDSKQNFISKKLKSDKTRKIVYCILVVIVLILWLINNYYATISKWLSVVIGIILYIVPLVVMRFIDHSYIKRTFCPNKAKKQYEEDFEKESPKPTN